MERRKDDAFLKEITADPNDDGIAVLTRSRLPAQLNELNLNLEYVSLLQCGCKGVASQLRERFGDAVLLGLSDTKYYRKRPLQL